MLSVSIYIINLNKGLVISYNMGELEDNVLSEISQT